MSDPAKAHVPDCPFCGSAWTAAMIAHYDAMSTASSCACCAPHHAHGGHEPAVKAAVPVSDLCCDSCGRAIYQAPSSVG